jgi:hypothetical protein
LGRQRGDAEQQHRSKSRQQMSMLILMLMPMLMSISIHAATVARHPLAAQFGFSASTRERQSTI